VDRQNQLRTITASGRALSALADLARLFFALVPGAAHLWGAQTAQPDRLLLR